MHQLRILFLSGRELKYVRNLVLLKAMDRLGWKVDVITARNRYLLPRAVKSFSRLSRVRNQRYDIGFAGFYGQPWAIILHRFFSFPVVLDAYVSTFDTICTDRQYFSQSSLMCKLIYSLDMYSAHVASHLLTDTRSNAQYFHDVFHVPYHKLTAIYVGCDEVVFFPQERPSVYPVEVFYYGSFLPLHGVNIIIQAAKLLARRTDIHFIIGGKGMKLKEMKRLAQQMKVSNIHFIGWIPMYTLPRYIARATLCLGGHFSTSPKAHRVISTKTFQFLAMRKPTIVGDNAATRELFIHGEHVWMVPMGDPEALAQAILLLADNNYLREHIAQGGFALFKSKLTLSNVAHNLKCMVEELI